VGIATGAQIPTIRDHSLHCVDYGLHSDEDFRQIKTGPYPSQIIEESNEDLDNLAEALTNLGVRVHRPPETDFSAIYSTPDWSVDGYHAYCPRDSILTVGTQAIETPMTLRHRANEARIYRSIVDTVPAPKPRLLDSIYDRTVRGVPTLKNHEPIFDAANCLKCGTDILFLISNTGNEAGAEWLRQHLGSRYRVHSVRDVYCFIHIDSTILPLRPGLVLLCPERVNERNMPQYFRNWDKIYAPEPVKMACEPEWNPASKWVSMNVFSIRPDLVVVEERQIPLIKLLERHGIGVLPIRLRHMRTMGGGPHCVTLDLVRTGTLEDYS
jgi:scyllo-inosamine-4-phosphate amidinotransferase 1